MSSTLKELQDMIQEKFGVESSSLDVNTSMSDQGIDSLTQLEFLFAIEERFGIVFSEERSDVNTLAGLAALIDRMRDAKAKAA